MWTHAASPTGTVISLSGRCIMMPTVLVETMADSFHYCSTQSSTGSNKASGYGFADKVRCYLACSCIELLIFGSQLL